jgi:two-component system nitrogen regulation sensor histidine kinase GlnL
VSLEHAIVESLTTPLLVVARNGRVHRGNAAAGAFWRVPAARLGELTVQHLFAGEPRVIAAVARAVDGEASSTLEGLRLEQGGGRPARFLRLQVAPLTAQQGPVELALIVVWDETHRQQLETTSREELLMDSIGMLVRRLAHELQNPLSGIKGSTQLLARRLAKLPEHAEYPRVILRELERMERLIRSLLSHGAEPPLHRGPFNLHALLEEVLWFVANSGVQVNLEREYDPSLPDLFADRDRMHQVFLNLIRNAVEASPPGGTVRIRTGMRGPWGEEGALPDPARTYFVIEVDDEGAGVPEAERQRLFTPFFTTKKAGTGLGLSISYQILRAHEGFLRYRSSPAGGSVFTVLLPLVEG